VVPVVRFVVRLPVLAVPGRPEERGRPALGWRTVTPAEPLCPGSRRLGGRSAHTELQAWKQSPLCPVRARRASTCDRGTSTENTRDGSRNHLNSTICCGLGRLRPPRVPRPRPAVPRSSPGHPPARHPTARTDRAMCVRSARVGPVQRGRGCACWHPLHRHRDRDPHAVRRSVAPTARPRRSTTTLTTRPERPPGPS